MTARYEYSGFMAEFWDLLRGDTSDWPDRRFYLQLLERTGNPVLDVACGTGRLLLDFLDHGYDVDGIDVSPEMLEICEDKAEARGISIDVYEQAMEDLDLPREFGTIIVASSAFQLIVDRRAAAEAMRRFHEHLRPGGALAMPFMTLWQGNDPPTQMPDSWTASIEVVRSDGAVIRRSTKSAFDIAEKLEHTEDLYEVMINGTVVDSEHHQRSPATRGYSQAEAVALYKEAGFTDNEVLRAWAFEPAGPDDGTFVVLGDRRS